MLSNEEMVSIMKGIEIYKLRFNVATFNNLPAVAVPVANSDTEGLPIGGEVLGGPGCDRRALHVAKVFEEILGRIEPPDLN